MYRFPHAAAAAAQLAYHPSLAATATALRAAVLCRSPLCEPKLGAYRVNSNFLPHWISIGLCGFVST